MKGFGALAQAAGAEGALEQGIHRAGHRHHPALPRLHRLPRKALAGLGASRQEMAEVAAMSVYMGGGPALMHAAEALRAFDQFSAAA